MAAYCRLARLDYTDDDLRAEGTLQREAEMASHVRAALDARKPGDGPVLVVVGGFHAVVLPDLLAGPPDSVVRATPAQDGDQRRGADQVHLRPARAAQRLRRRHDLARVAPAAVGAPDRGPDGPAARNAATLVSLLDITRELRRKHQLPVSLPSVSAAYGQALQLAALRDRAAPLRSDLLDARHQLLRQGRRRRGGTAGAVGVATRAHRGTRRAWCLRGRVRRRWSPTRWPACAPSG